MSDIETSDGRDDQAVHPQEPAEGADTDVEGRPDDEQTSDPGGDSDPGASTAG